MANNYLKSIQSEQRGILSKFDWWLIFLFSCLLSVGWFTIYSSSSIEFDGELVLKANYTKQLIFSGLSLVILILILNLNTHFFDATAFYIYILSLLSLLGLFVLGKEVNGASSWYGIGSFSIQPSEFAKYATMLFLAKTIGDPNFDLSNLRQQLFVVAIVILPAVIIVPQPDPGSALMFCSLFFVLYREGVNGIYFGIVIVLILLFFLYMYLTTDPWVTTEIAKLLDLVDPSKDTHYLDRVIRNTPEILRKINSFVNYGSSIILAVIGVLILVINRKKYVERYILKNRIVQISGIVFFLIVYLFSINFIFNHVFADRHRNRFKVMFNENIDPLGVGYHLKQSKTAIGYGGLTGEGVFEGKLTKGEFVPERSTDYIFCTIGEETGFIGSCLITLLYMAFIWRVFVLAERNEQTFTRVFGYSLGCLLLFHYLINVGMITGILPTIGVPLPFFSYGGSSLLAFSLMVFTFIKLESESIFG